MQKTIQIADKPTLDDIKALLENSGYGLDSIKTVLDTANTNASNANTYAKSADTLLKNSTYGLQAIKSALGGIGVVKSVQRGVVASSTSSNVTVNINEVDTSKCIYILQQGTSQSYGQSMPCVVNGTPTSFTISPAYYTSGSTTLRSMNVYWQVVEFY